MFCTFGSVFLVFHGATNLEIGDIIPPNPWFVELVGGNIKHAQLPQILHHHLLTIIANIEILFRVRCTVPPLVDALSFTLLAINKRLRAIPCDVMRSEECIATLLQDLCNTFEALDKFNLVITFRATFIIAVGPKLIFNSLIWMWE